MLKKDLTRVKCRENFFCSFGLNRVNRLTKIVEQYGLHGVRDWIEQTTWLSRVTSERMRMFNFS